MPEILTPDICVIGAGSGGLTVAAGAAAFGVPVVLIERHKMGGDCLNYGCVPSKALIAAAKKAEAVRKAAEFGISTGPLKVDFGRVHDHIREVIAGIAPHDSVERFTALGVRVIRAAGRFAGPDRVLAGDFEIRARRFVIATGSAPMMPPIAGLDQVPCLTNETVFDLTTLPARLIIIGGGPIGIELAQAFNRLGSRVVVLEAVRALGRDDPELAGIVLETLRREGVDIREGVRIDAVERLDEGVCLTLSDPAGTTRLQGSRLLVAAGRRPNIDDLDLAEAGIAFDRRGVKVDRGLRTSNRRVYAIGDVAGGLQFTHVAGYHAGLVLRSILFRLPVRENRDILPWVTYTDPELAHVGLDEAAARQRFGAGVRVLTWPFAENDRARAERATTGMVKVVTAARGRIVGATIIGAAAGELISLYALAISQRRRISAFAGFVAPYPTRAEITRRVALSYYSAGLTKPWIGRIIALLRRLG